MPTTTIVSINILKYISGIKHFSASVSVYYSFNFYFIPCKIYRSRFSFTMSCFQPMLEQVIPNRLKLLENATLISNIEIIILVNETFLERSQLNRIRKKSF